MRNHRRIAIAPRQVDRVESLADRADLIHLDEDCVRDLLLDAALEAVGIGDEQIVADELHLFTQRGSKRFPTGPVVFRHAVFDAGDRIIMD